VIVSKISSVLHAQHPGSHEKADLQESAKEFGSECEAQSITASLVLEGDAATSLLSVEEDRPAQSTVWQLVG